MAKAKIVAGNCGYYAEVTAEKIEDFNVAIQIETDCPHIKKIADTLTEVNALNEISFKRGDREILTKGAEYCAHASCPVPVGIIKTMEVAAGLALPQAVSIEFVED